ncbi:MAG: DUF6062 family protein [Desulfitobacteriaceae bacterium]
MYILWISLYDRAWIAQDIDRRLTELRAELQEFIRKQDYRYSHEPLGKEKDAWKHAMYWQAGIYNP